MEMIEIGPFKEMKFIPIPDLEYNEQGEVIFMTEPYNNKEFMDWAFDKQEVSLGLDGYHKILDKLYVCYLYIGKIDERLKMIRELDEVQIELTKEEINYLLYLCQTAKVAAERVIDETSHNCLRNILKNIESVINKLSEKKC